MRDNICFTVPEFMSAAECEAWITRTEAIGFEEAPVTTAYGPVNMPDVRNNTRVMLDDVAHATALWDRLHAHVDAVETPVGLLVPVGLNERLRFYRYAPGQVFRWHRDGAFERASGERSRLTFMVYLNDNFEGGATEFTDSVVTPRRGMALVFSHGLRHQGAVVTRGDKYVLRSDVMFSRA